MHSHILNNCKFSLENITLVDRRKLELILLCYNIGWGYYKETTILKYESIRDAKYIWVKDSILWQSPIGHQPFDYLPSLDVKEILLNY